jgi:prevent-host-death family protein
MTKIRMPISRFKASCTQLLREVAAAEKLIEVTRHGRVVALVTPPPRRAARASFWGGMRGTSKAMDDLVKPALRAAEWTAAK